MARIFEPAPERKSNDLLAMNAIKVAHLNDWYKRCQPPPLIEVVACKSLVD
jgi:hypothetical protein